jgi:hypothetical protein
MDGKKTILEMFGVTLEFLTDVVRANPSLRGVIIGYLAERKLWEELWPDDPSKRRITAIRKDDDHDRDNKGDLLVTYKGFDFRIEVKSLQTNSIQMLNSVSKKWMNKVLKIPIPKLPGQKRQKNTWKECELYRTHWQTEFTATKFKGKVQCDASDKREICLSNGRTIKTTCLKVDEFDILAMGLFAFREQWEFGYMLNRDLPRSTYHKYPEADRQYLLKTLIPIEWPLPSNVESDLFKLLDRLVEEKKPKKKS